MQPWNTVQCSKENSPTLWHIGHYRMVLAPTFWFLRLLLSLYEQKLYAKQRKLRFLTNTCAQWRSQSMQSHPHKIDVKFSLILVKKKISNAYFISTCTANLQHHRSSEHQWNSQAFWLDPSNFDMQPYYFPQQRMWKHYSSLLGSYKLSQGIFLQVAKASKLPFLNLPTWNLPFRVSKTNKK